MPTTLVTGANGFVGSTVVDALLSAPHHHDVIIAVRTPSSAASLLSANPSWPRDKIQSQIVPDFTAPGAFDSTFQEFSNIDYVIHVAAPLLDDPRNVDFVEHFEKPNVMGNLELLRSAKTYGRNVKAISITGSINAITTGSQEDISARVLGNNEWLPMGREDAVQMQNNYISYCVGKKLAEQTVWKFVEEDKPSFSVTNFLPPLIFGPMRQNVPSVQKVNFSNTQIHSIIKSAEGEAGKVPNTMFPAYIDVRDLAQLQVLALTTPGAANKRFVVGHPMMNNDFANALRNDSILNIASRIGENNEDGSKLVLPKLDTKDAENVFQFKWRSIGETARDTAESLLKVESLPA